MQYIPGNRCYGANYPQADPGNAPPTWVETITQTKDCRTQKARWKAWGSIRKEQVRKANVAGSKVDPVHTNGPHSSLRTANPKCLLLQALLPVIWIQLTEPSLKLLPCARLEGRHGNIYSSGPNSPCPQWAHSLKAKTDQKEGFSVKVLSLYACCLRECTAQSFRWGIERRREQICGHSGGRGGWDESEDWDDIYTLPCVKEITSGQLLHSTGS